MQGFTLKLSTSYNPQCLETYLHCFCNNKAQEWVKWLAWAMHWYNTSWKTSTGFTPYEALCGRSPPSMLQYVPITTKVQAVEDTLYDKDRIIKLLKDNLNHAKNKIKFFADKKRSTRCLEVGDFALLKLQPYKQTSLKSAMPQKLAPKYYGAYQILEKIGKVAYRIQLPIEAKIYNVFYFSKLKKYHGTLPIAYFGVSTIWEDVIRQLEKVIAWRICK